MSFPKYAIISDAKGNDYGHPHQTTLDKLNAKNISVFRTDLNGTIIATSNGTTITFNVKPIDKSADVAPTKKEAVNNTSNAEKTTTSNSTDNITKNVTPDTNTTATTPSTNQNEEMVWVANKTAKVYHSSKTCSNMKNPTQMSLADAQAKGLKPCSKCH